MSSNSDESNKSDDLKINYTNFKIENILSNSIENKPNCSKRIPSPPRVIKTEYIIKEYHGEPKTEKETCLIEKRIKVDKDVKDVKSVKRRDQIELTDNNKKISKRLLIGGGVAGALLSVYLLSKGCVTE